MKKLLTFAVMIAMTRVASAVALSWGWGSGSLFVAEEGKSTGVSAAKFSGNTDGVSLVLVYLGTSSSFSAADVTADKVVDSIAYGFSGDEEESFWNPRTKTFNVTADGGYSAGDYFGIAYLNGSDYKLISDISDWDSGTLGGSIAPVAQVTSLAANAPVVNLAASATKFTTDGAAAISVSAQTTPVVPEPATGALALAGIALLFRRRKA